MMALTKASAWATVSAVAWMMSEEFAQDLQVLKNVELSAFVGFFLYFHPTTF